MGECWEIKSLWCLSSFSIVCHYRGTWLVWLEFGQKMLFPVNDGRWQRFMLLYMYWENSQSTTLKFNVLTWVTVVNIQWSLAYKLWKLVLCHLVTKRWTCGMWVNARGDYAPMPCACRRSSFAVIAVWHICDKCVCLCGCVCLEFVSKGSYWNPQWVSGFTH